MLDQDSAPLEHLLKLHDLQPVADESPAATSGGPSSRTYRGRSEANGTGQLYGGLLVSQALAAAGQAVPLGYEAHSLHAGFLQPGRPGVPVDYRVEQPVTTTEAFTRRRVSAFQRKRQILALTASFHRPEPGPEHQTPMPNAPEPETLPTYEESLSKALGEHVEPLGKPFDMRYAGAPSFAAARDPALRSATTTAWVRFAGVPQTAGVGGREHLLHCCLLAYVSDTSPFETVLNCHGLSPFGDVTRSASLDHTVWFHRPFRVDDWLLCALETSTAAGARSLVHGRFFTRAGQLVASVAQELLVRVTPEALAARTPGPVDPA